jgi:NAD(P)-dependent dehydrogenase (short-subunit alcohol dehydrogenase family)
MAQSKIALVTGGSRGLGRDMALSLARKGLDVVVTYNTNKNEADKVVAEIKLIGQKATTLKLNAADVRSFDEFKSTLQKSLTSEFSAEKIDFLINNGGTRIIVPSFADTTEEQFDGLMNVHLKGVFFLTQKLLNVLTTVVEL